MWRPGKSRRQANGLKRLLLSGRTNIRSLEWLEPRMLLTSGPIISEFQAINDSTIQDRDGQFSDWIEVANPGPTPIQLRGWYLTDDATNLRKWRFPEVTLDTNHEIVVFASGKNRVDDATELHTNFKLSGSGEYLALVNPDGVTVAQDFGFRYPAQVADQSYGLPANNREAPPEFFSIPTPGQKNSLPAAPQPQLIGQQGVFFGSTLVELTLEEPRGDLEIRYTVDGSEPLADSMLYAAPLTLTESTMLQAKTFSTSQALPLAPSHPVSGTFVAMTEGLRDRDSDIPLLVLDTIGQQLPSSNSTILAPTNVVLFDSANEAGRFSLDDGDVGYLGRGGVRRRGASTASQEKPNLAFETWGPSGTNDEDDFDVSLAGFAPESDWVLYAPFEIDLALIRNQVTYAMSNAMGRWAPGTQAIEVYLNDGNGTVEESDYVGVYILMEKIKRGPDRVDIQGITQGATTEPEITGGYIWKIDRLDPGQLGFPAGGQTLNWVYPKSPTDETARDDQKATQNQQQWAIDYFTGFHSALSNPVTQDLYHPDGYAKYLDVAAAIDYNLLQVVTKNVDALRLSTYLHKDRDGKIQFGPVWDCDRCMDSSSNGDEDPLNWGGSYFGHPWWIEMFQDTNFWQAYVDRWTELRRSQLSNEAIDSIIDTLADEIAESTVRDLARWEHKPRSVSQYESGKLDGTWEGEVEHLRAWLRDRVEFIDQNFAAPPAVFVGESLLPADVQQQTVQVDSQISITGPFGELFDDNHLVSSNEETIVRYLVPVDDAETDVWHQIDFDDAGWQSGPTGLGVGKDFAEFFRTEVDPRTVKDGATTVYSRYEFELSDLQEVTRNRLVLRMKYDDGFVVYLNGTEVDRVNLRSDDLAWNSRANAFPKPDAVRWHDFDITQFRDQLVAGKNVLGIRIINSSPTSGDLLLLPELISRKVEVGPNPNGQVYYTTDGTDPRGTDGNPTATATLAMPGKLFSITEDVRVTARYFDDITDRGFTSSIVPTDWSGLTIYDFAVVDTIPGDFDGDGIVAAADIDLLTAEIRSAQPMLRFDLTGDLRVDLADRERLVQGILQTNYGDSNLDGRFDSEDLVQIFRAGQYEDEIPLNSGWADGDWDGNGEFDTGDLVVAFRSGAYRAAAKMKNIRNP